MYIYIYIYIYAYINQSSRSEGSAPAQVEEGDVQRKGFLSVKVPVAYHPADMGALIMITRIKMDQKGHPKRTQLNQKETKRESQKGAKVRNCCSKIKPWSVQKIRFSTVSFVRQICKKGHGALVGLTFVKGKCGKFLSLFCFEKIFGKMFLALVRLTNVRGTIIRKKVTELGGTTLRFWQSFWSHFL